MVFQQFKISRANYKIVNKVWIEIKMLPFLVSFLDLTTFFQRPHLSCVLLFELGLQFRELPRNVFVVQI